MQEGLKIQTSAKGRWLVGIRFAYKQSSVRMVMNLFLAVFSIGLVFGVAGCGSVKQSYKPSQLGNLGDHQPGGGIEVEIVPDKYRARIGDPLSFKVVIRNVSDQTILFPADPDLLLTWVYPDGRRDNLIRGEKKGSPKAIALGPGESIVMNSVITTYYFDRTGIHEFRAVVRGEDVAMSPTSRVWAGRAVSNGFGVLFEAR